MSFVYYRLPGDELYHYAESSQTHIVTELGERGFVVAPFVSNASTPAILIPIDDVQSGRWEVNACRQSVEMNRVQFETDTSEEAAALSPDESYRTAFEKFHDDVSKGNFRKLVLSRSKTIKLDEAVDPKELFFNACAAYPSLMVMLYSTPYTGTWLSATPEILLESEGTHYHTVALAGTMRTDGKLRDRDYELKGWSDKNREEQNVVERFIVDTVSKFSDLVDIDGPYTSPAGALIHLKTDIYFKTDCGKLDEIVKALHPTPAVCGLPRKEAKAFILNNEGGNRHYYSGFAGPVGIDGETRLFVQLRCMELSDDGKSVTLYAGGGIMPESDCLSEFLETEHKMETICTAIRKTSTY